MKTIENLEHIAFPKCAKECELVKMLGVCECDAACPRKFRIPPERDAESEALTQIELDILLRKEAEIK
jgi:hypothetical protein